jgi:hypothetical protein
VEGGTSAGEILNYKLMNEIRYKIHVDLINWNSNLLQREEVHIP